MIDPSPASMVVHEGPLSPASRPPSRAATDALDEPSAIQVQVETLSASTLSRRRSGVSIAAQRPVYSSLEIVTVRSVVSPPAPKSDTPLDWIGSAVRSMLDVARDVLRSAALVSQGQHSRIDLPGAPALVMYRPTPISIAPSAPTSSSVVGEQVWRAQGLETDATGSSPHAALEAWAGLVRDETERLLCAPTHLLEPEERRRKRLLLGAIDVLASHIGPKAEDLWVAGSLEREGDGVVLVTSDGERYPLAPALRSEIDVSAPYRVGRIRLDAYQQPEGEIFELDSGDPVDPDAIWAEWTRRVGEG